LQQALTGQALKDRKAFVLRALRQQRARLMQRLRRAREREDRGLPRSGPGSCSPRRRRSTVRFVRRPRRSGASIGCGTSSGT
jgi:hypothetical protein